MMSFPNLGKKSIKLRLCLITDKMNLFDNSSTYHNSWPILQVIYNLSLSYAWKIIYVVYNVLWLKITKKCNKYLFKCTKWELNYCGMRELKSFIDLLMNSCHVMLYYQLHFYI